LLVIMPTKLVGTNTVRLTHTSKKFSNLLVILVKRKISEWKYVAFSEKIRSLLIYGQLGMHLQKSLWKT
jgi:hypothetical protein